MAPVWYARLHKAFDSVSWPYLFGLLEEWGFGTDFLALLQVLYSHPVARVQLRGFHSNPIPIARGTRQGCPLSSLIFVIAIQTLVIAIRSDSNIHGADCDGPTHKCALFTDDLLCLSPRP